MHLTHMYNWQIIIYEYNNQNNGSFLTLILLLANLANTK